MMSIVSYQIYMEIYQCTMFLRNQPDRFLSQENRTQTNFTSLFTIYLLLYVLTSLVVCRLMVIVGAAALLFPRVFQIVAQIQALVKMSKARGTKKFEIENQVT